MRKSFLFVLPLLAPAVAAPQSTHFRASEEEQSARARTLNIVYCGAGAGPSENLRRISEHLPPDRRGDLKTDTTLFSDSLTVDMGTADGPSGTVTLRLHLSATSYAPTQKLLLKDADGIVFVASAAPGMARTNEETFASLGSNLKEWGYDREVMPLVFQVVGSDGPGARSAAAITASLGSAERQAFAADPATGAGIGETLLRIIQDAALRRNKVVGNEVRAIRGLRSIVSAQAAYAEANAGFYDSRLECLAAPSACIGGYSGPPFLPGSDIESTRDGYHYQMFSKTAPRSAGEAASQGSSSTSAIGYAVVAWPVTRGVTGSRTFCADSCGIVCAVPTAVGQLIVEEAESKPWVHCATSCLGLP